MVRYVDRDTATVWVETDRPCAVSVIAGDRSATEETWSVHGHHYSLVQLTDLEPGSVRTYTVELDGHEVWPDPDSSYPPSVIRTLGGGETFRLSFGSCRRTAPFDDGGLEGFGADALVALADRMAVTGYQDWPDALLMVGDQIYADEPSPELTDRLLAAHADGPPGRKEIAGEVWNFEEYTWLYHESWSPEPVRWLLSTVPTCMLLDDHDLRDDWNTSVLWREQMTGSEWWRDRVVGAFGSYWVYQHLGNMSPTHLAEDPLFRLFRGEKDEAVHTQALDDFAWRSDAEVGSARWSFVRDFGDVHASIRLVAIDCRASRHLEPEHRVMVDDREWQWIVEQSTGRPDGRPITHLLLGATLPVLLPRGIHHLEGWNEAWGSGRYGQRALQVAEWTRRAVDLEHWSAFRLSFGRVVSLLRQVSTSDEPPASVLFLSGDVHCSYVAAASIQDTEHPGTSIRQLTMSPFRNPLPFALRMVNRVVEKAGVRHVLRGLSRSVAVPDTGLDWALTSGPWFENGVMTVVINGRDVLVEIDHARHIGPVQYLQRSETPSMTSPASARS